jgi:multisubunit Na+/H+ antiporter MnhE subunit
VRLIRAAGFWLIVFVFAFAVWLVHDDSGKLPELLAGVGVAALAATGTELVRRQRVAAIAVRPRFLRRLPRLMPSAARDCFALTLAAFAQLVRPRAVRGDTVAVPFDGGSDTPRDNGRRAVASALGSFAPGTVVVGVDPDSNLVIAHQLPVTKKPSDIDPLELG